MFQKPFRLALVGLTSLFMASPLHAVIFSEMGDAGRLISTAQPTAASAATAGQPLTMILGSLLTALDIDIFVINITNPAAFSATTVNALTGAGNLDTSLFLFDSLGRPVYANDDDPSGTTLGSTLPAGSALGPQVAGIYYIAVSLSGAEPINFANINLFTFAPSTSLRGPNSFATNGLADWDTQFVNGTGMTFPGSYQIDLTGAVTSNVPEPTTIALSVFGALALVAAVKKRRS